MSSLLLFPLLYLLVLLLNNINSFIYGLLTIKKLSSWYSIGIFKYLLFFESKPVISVKSFSSSLFSIVNINFEKKIIII